MLQSFSSLSIVEVNFAKMMCLSKFPVTISVTIRDIDFIFDKVVAYHGITKLPSLSPTCILEVKFLKVYGKAV